MSSATPTKPAPPPEGRSWQQLLPMAAGSAAVVVGWTFIGWHNHFHLTPSVLFLALGWLAVVLGGVYVWRTMVSSAAVEDEHAAWWLPTGTRDELEREKRSLLKAIKEVEFDHQLGKTSKEDAEVMTKLYRARAIDVIKALDALEGGGGVREQIEREVRARVALSAAEGASSKKAKRKAAAAARSKPVETDGAPGSKAAETDGAPNPTISDKSALPQAENTPALADERDQRGDRDAVTDGGERGGEQVAGAKT